MKIPDIQIPTLWDYSKEVLVIRYMACILYMPCTLVYLYGSVCSLHASHLHIYTMYRLYYVPSVLCTVYTMYRLHYVPCTSGVPCDKQDSFQFLELVTTNHRMGFHHLGPFKNISLLVSFSPLESYQMMRDILCKRLCTYTWYEAMSSTFGKPKNVVNG